jgi:type I restriction enzyme R subunit
MLSSLQKPRLNIFDDFTYFDPRADVDVSRRNLPHWQQEGRTYFVTFRLHDSLPQEKLKKLREDRVNWLEDNPEPWSAGQSHEYHELFSETVQQWLDAGHGSCLLKDPALARIVVDALRHFDGERYDLVAWVVMPNHVHALVTPRHGFALGKILHSWKSFSAHEINKQAGKLGDVWQHETYDHIVRDPDSMWHFAKYIVDNPLQAGLHVPHVESRIKVT